MIYRSKKLLHAFKEAPMCFLCEKKNEGSVVAAHSNQMRDGHGMGIKSHDYRIAGLCYACHTRIDNGKGTRLENLSDWEMAHRKTIAWMFESGIVGVL